MKKMMVEIVLFVSLVGMNTTVFAENNVGNSQSDIDYTLNTHVVSPQHPQHPENPIVPKPDNPGTGDTNPLSLDFISIVHFGNQTIYGEDTTYYADLDTVLFADGTTEPVPNYIQVTDHRGNNSGWSLSVKQVGQFKNSKGQSLDKAELKFKNGTPNSLKLATLAPPKVNQDMIFRVDETEGIDSTMQFASANAGIGTWTTRFGDTNELAKKSIELFVPGETKVEKGAYTTTLVWTLISDAAQ